MPPMRTPSAASCNRVELEDWPIVTNSTVEAAAVGGALFDLGGAVVAAYFDRAQRL